MQNYDPKNTNYYQQTSGQPYQPNQMSNNQPPQGQMQQPPYGQQSSYGQNPMYNPQQNNQMQQPPYGQPYPQQNYGQQPPYSQQQGGMQQPPYSQQQGGMQQPPYGQQPSYGPVPQQGNMIPQNYGGDPDQTDIPSFKLSGRGKGIDEKEYYVITHSAYNALNAKEDPLSNGIIKRIKNDLGGEWMVFASVEGLKGYDFSLSIVTGNDFLSFTIQNFHFQVCRLRD